ncbi:MAG TPA: hypothetical protein PKE66_12410, partial [Pyrinomonadaceae bacterium]|nr:hypothetical protein [Pyrinomonadaceae bacterium]
MRKIIFGALLGILAATGGLAQEHTENKSDQVLRGSGRVNPSTLGMEISVPLANYPGRGINVPISLNYSSKVWRMDYQNDTEGGIVTGGCRSVHEARFGENSASGWTTSLAVPYIEYVGRDNLFNERGFPYGVDTCVNAPPNHYQSAYIRRLVVHLPGGESHELRSDDSPEIFQFGQGNDPFHQSSWNRTFYAVDGSNLRYIENSTNGTFRLQMPDGSFYDFATSHGAGVDGATIRKATKFTDRNGNFTSYDLGTGIWTDTLGRELAPPIGPTAPAEASTINYSLPGLNGTYKLIWKR